MDDNYVNLNKRIDDLEKRIKVLEKTDEVKPASEPITIRDSKSTGIPAMPIIMLIIGGIILLNAVPGLFYNYSRLGPFSIFFAILGGLLVVLSLRSIMEHKKASRVESKKVAELKTTPQVSSQSTIGTIDKEAEKEPAQSFEFQIASHWFSIVGIIAIVLAVVLFLKFAFDNNLIGPVGQVTIGIVIGVALVFGREFLREKYQKYSQILTGGGIIVLYLSLWASYAVFAQLSAPIVLFAMSLITLCSALLSIRYQAAYISALGILGGYATPMLLAKGFDNQMILMFYIIVLSLGVLTIAAFQNWRKLNILGFIATYIV